MKVKRGAKRNIDRYHKILSLRGEGKSINQIARELDITRQGVWYYLERYGDFEDKWDSKKVENK